MNKDLLKKHHFWILFAPFTLFTLIAVFTLWSGIGDKIEAREKDIEKEDKAAKGKTAIKPKVELELLEVENARVGLIRFDKWRENWALQIGVNEYGDAEQRVMKQERENQFRWPLSPMLAGFNYAPKGYTEAAKVEDKKPLFKGLKFGDDIPNERSELSAFKDATVYLAEYSSIPYATVPTKYGMGTGMADRMYPTQFAGGWPNVLRHVYAADAAAGYGWGPGKPSVPAVWLALEDLWVQRSLLTSLRSVNERSAAISDKAPNGEPLPLVNGHKTFQNRTWQLEVWPMTRASDNKPVLVGRLTNLTPRIQTFGLGGKLTFKVQIKGGGPPVDLVFHERYLTGLGGTKTKQDGAAEKQVPGDSVTILPEKGADLSMAGPAVEIESVYQVFDARTVPIQRIDRLVLGYPDSRLAAMKPKPSEAIKPDEVPAAATGDSSMPGPMGPGGTAAPGGPGGSGANTTGWTVVAGPVTSKTLLDSTKLRYLEATKQVRRMPVGMVLVIDQANLQDVLMALANSPLRFQITQVHWQRFRGTLAGPDSGSPGSPGSNNNVLTFGGGLGSSDGIGGGNLGPRVNPGSGRPRPGTSPGPMGPAPMGPGPGPGGPGASGDESGDGDVQMTSGLIEVSIYGIVSLYEKYEPEQATPTTNP